MHVIVSLDKSPPWTKVSLDNCLLGLMSPRTNVSLDKCPLDNRLLGQLSPWTHGPWTNVSTPYRDMLNQVMMDTYRSRMNRLKHSINPQGMKSASKQQIAVGGIVLMIRPKFGLVDTGLVLEINKTQAKIKFRSGVEEWHSIANLVPLMKEELAKEQKL